jgi:CheY-like chemotaxis protein
MALTAYARPQDRAKVLAAGFQMHVTKPVAPDEFLEAVSTLARRSGDRMR